MNRPPRVLHSTSEPLVFFGREDELALLDAALGGEGPSVVAFAGPGGQGKTAIVRHWLDRLKSPVEGLFFWSFYRGKDADLCLREWLAYAEGLDAPPEVSASWCADRLVAALRRERWAVVLDGAEVVQHEEGPWRGRFVHPDLGRLLEELASEPTPGVVAVTTRFELPTLARRPFARVLALDRLDPASARGLLASLGVSGDLDAAAETAGRHAKAVELLGTYLARWYGGRAEAAADLPAAVAPEGATDEEASVARVLSAFHRALSRELQDVVALATAFREPPAEPLLLGYLASPAVRSLVHGPWGREYTPFAEREKGWLAAAVEELVALRLLERVALRAGRVIDAHPLVRRGFEHSAGSALARAGFLRGMPDRRRPAALGEAREALELFHAFCDAGLWAEADSAYRGLDNPKHRFLAPALERDLLLRFFPGGDWRRPPLWPGFGRWRSSAICFEMLGQFEDALEAYRPADAALRGDALIAVGRLGPLLEVSQVPAPWQELWQSYRCHALCLAGRADEGLRLARGLFPQDVYEWAHVFECLLRAGGLAALDPRALSGGAAGEHRWSALAWRRMRADRRRVVEGASTELLGEYAELLEEYDRAGLAWERALTRLSRARLRRALDGTSQADALEALELARRHGMGVIEADALTLLELFEEAGEVRRRVGYSGPQRP